MIHARRRESRRVRGDVRQLSSLYEVVPLHEVLAERSDQDLVGAQRAESLGQRRRQWVRLVVLGWWKNEFPRDPVGARGGEAGQTEVRVSRCGRGAVPASQCISRVDGVPTR